MVQLFEDNTSNTDFQAFWGIPGYTFKGVYKELQKHLGSSVQNYIVAARTAQGYDEWIMSSKEERLDVVGRWHATQLELSRGMHQVRHASFRTPQEILKSRHTSYEEKRKATEAREKQKQPLNTHNPQSLRSRDSFPITGSASARPTNDNDADSNNVSFEEAIQSSILATSKGNPEEDRLIERAIRASVVELQLASGQGDGDDAVQRAIQASIAEASRARNEGGSAIPDQVDGISNHDQQLEAALRQSMLEHNQFGESHYENTHVDSDDPEIATDDDENIKSAIEMSRASTAEKRRTESEENIEKAIQESRIAHEAHEQELSKTKTEEEIVLDYIKKQSEAEERYRNARTANGTSSVSADGAELQRAMEGGLNLQRAEY